MYTIRNFLFFLLKRLTILKDRLTNSPLNTFVWTLLSSYVPMWCGLVRVWNFWVALKVLKKFTNLTSLIYGSFKKSIRRHFYISIFNLTKKKNILLKVTYKKKVTFLSYIGHFIDQLLPNNSTSYSIFFWMDNRLHSKNI